MTTTTAAPEVTQSSLRGVFHVASSTRTKLAHIVRVDASTGRMTCTCEAGRLGRMDHCKHRRAVLEHLKAVTGADVIRMPSERTVSYDGPADPFEGLCTA